MWFSATLHIYEQFQYVASKLLMLEYPGVREIIRQEDANREGGWVRECGRESADWSENVAVAKRSQEATNIPMIKWLSLIYSGG